MRALIGIVGHSPILDRYPLGPLLMRDLQSRDWGTMIVDIENMTWSPIHVTQRLQDQQNSYDRTVLIGSSAGCLKPGNVVTYRWLGGEMSTLKLQERVYEGVTGVVSLDNTLPVGFPGLITTYRKIQLNSKIQLKDQRRIFKIIYSISIL